ncbi:MAG TPA: hypothetical protein VGK37_01210 [Casimicrobiaceae bacterium]|jgi:hypothetical protein
MISPTSRLLLGASLALFLGAAGAQNAPDSTSRMPAAKGTTSTMPAQPSAQPTDKMAADPNATTQGTAAEKNAASNQQAAAAKPAAMHHARKTAHSHETVSPQEKSYRQALRQCVQENSESQRDNCIDNAIEQHQPNS